MGGFVQCEQARFNAQGYSAYTVEAHSTANDVTIKIVPHLSANSVERITSVGLLGVSDVPGVNIPAGTPLLPNVSRTATYPFTQDDATIVVHTTTGDQTVRIPGARAAMPQESRTRAGSERFTCPCKAPGRGP